MSSRANAVEVLRDAGRGNTSRSVNLRDARPGRLPDRRHLRAAGRIAAAGALDHQPADDRLRLRHRRHHFRPHGSDGRRLPVAGGAEGVLRSAAAASSRAMPEFEAVGADQPLPDGLLRQRPDRDRREDSTARTAIGRTRTSSRSAAASSPSPGSSCSRGAPSPPTISTRASRSRSSTPRSRGSTTAPRARSAGGSARSPATASSRARGGRSSASSRPSG